jgi:hypothetical protein
MVTTKSDMPSHSYALFHSVHTVIYYMSSFNKNVPRPTIKQGKLKIRLQETKRSTELGSMVTQVETLREGF